MHVRRKATVIHRYYSELELDSLVGWVKTSMVSLLVMITFVYAILFIPLSYVQDVTRFDFMWSLTINVLAIGSALAATFYPIEWLRTGRPNIWLYLVVVLGFMFLSYISFVLGFLGLVSVDAFLPLPLMLLISICAYVAVYGEQCFASYRSYLLKAMAFAETGTMLVMVLCFVYAIGQLRMVVAELYASPVPGLTHFVSLLKIVAAFYLLRCAKEYITVIKIGDKAKFLSDVCVVGVLVVVIEVFSWLFARQIDVWWIGMFALVTSILYVEHNPTRRRVSLPAYSGFGLFVIFFCLHSLGVDLVEALTPGDSSPLRSMFDLATRVGKIVQSLMALTGVTLAVLLERLRRRRHVRNTSVKRSDVEDAYQELFSEELSIRGINNGVALALMTGTFDRCAAALQQHSAGDDPELLAYARTYLRCVEFQYDGRVALERDGEGVEITSPEAFREYVRRTLPTRIGSIGVWNNYFNNGYIRRWIPEATLVDLRPPTRIDQVKRVVRNGIIATVLLVFVLNMTPAPLLAFVPSAISAAHRWHSGRLADLRLKFVEAEKPFQHQRLKAYYENTVPAWLEDWRSLNSREENGVAIMTAADLRQELHWTGVVIGFTNGKSNNLGALHERAAGLARALGDCDRAWRHHQAAVSFNPDPARVDVESAALALCYGEKGELDRARRFLMSSGLPGPLSRGVLAEIHFAANEFQNVADVLSGVDVEAPTSGRSQVLLRLASAELQAQAGQYTQAADLYWKGFIAELLALRAKTPGTRRREWYRDVLSIDSGLPHHFKSAIDRVVPDGHERVNDWLLVYSILVGDRVGVERYFRLLAASGSQQRESRALMDYMNELRGRVAAR